MIHLSKKGTFSSSQSHWHSQQEHICFVYFPSTLLEEKIIPQRVAGQRRLAISRLRVPKLDGAVATAAGNLLSIRAPRHRKDPEIKWSQQTNPKKQRGKNLKLTDSSARSPGTRKRLFGNLLHSCHFQACIYQQQVTYSSGLSYRHSKIEHNFFFLF